MPGKTEDYLLLAQRPAGAYPRTAADAELEFPPE